MPGGDRTGPAGWGPMTGRAAGFCAGYGVPGYANPIPGRGFWGWGGGRGRGWGWGRRNWYYATGLTGPQRAAAWPPAWGAPQPYAAWGAPGATQGQELDVLKDQAEYFSEALDEIRKRIKELEAKEE